MNKLQLFMAGLAWVLGSTASAATLDSIEFQVFDRGGKPVPGVPVYVGATSKKLTWCDLGWDGPGKYPCVDYVMRGERELLTDSEGVARFKPIQGIRGKDARAVIKLQDWVLCGGVGRSLYRDDEVIGCKLILQNLIEIESFDGDRIQCQLRLSSEEILERVALVQANGCVWQRGIF